MRRFALVFAVGLWAAGPAAAGSWADSLFDDLSRDFGSVPRGPTLTHPFRVINKTGSPVHIAGVRVSCGCVTATALKSYLAPGEETAVYAQMDTRRFSGPKTVTVYVQFDRPQWAEVRLLVQANGRDDVSLAPEALEFGQVKHGAGPAAGVQVTVAGGWKVTGARCESNYVQTEVEERQHEGATGVYQVTARLRADTPVGKWYTDVWLTTDNPATPRVRVPLTVEVESALTVSPAVAVLGQVKPGAEVERKVIVRGTRPFKITKIEGADAVLRVQDSAKDAKPVHVLTLRLKAKEPGDFERTLRVRTDLQDEGEIDFQATAQVVR